MGPASAAADGSSHRSVDSHAIGVRAFHDGAAVACDDFRPGRWAVYFMVLKRLWKRSDDVASNRLWQSSQRSFSYTAET